MSPVLTRIEEQAMGDLDWLRSRAPEIGWRWASTFADNYPHMYVIRGKHLAEADYVRLFKVITRQGEPRRFLNRINIELHLPDLALEFGPVHNRQVIRGVKFWAMSDHLDDSEAINIAPHTSTYGDQSRVPSTHSDHALIYDTLAHEYDERYDREHCAECQHENTQVWRLVTEAPMLPRLANDPATTGTGTGPGVTAPDLLDIGAGTGLALDLRLSPPDHPDLYCAVDPSQPMLNRLCYKHAWVSDVHPMTAEEYLDANAANDNGSGPRRFDTVVSLFGAASYLEPASLRALPALARRQVVLMVYEDGYRPDYYTDETWPAATARRARSTVLALLDDYPSHHSRLGHFEVVRLWTAPRMPFRGAPW